jgi:hypothetical protein
MTKLLVYVVCFFEAGIGTANARDSLWCQGRPSCISSWCNRFYSCQPDKVALRAAVGVLTADGHPDPLTKEVYPLDSLMDGYGVILSYSGVQFTYRVIVHGSDCRVKNVELTDEL